MKFCVCYVLKLDCGVTKNVLGLCPSKRHKDPKTLGISPVIGISFLIGGASLVAQTVKHLSAMQETQVRYLGREDPLETEMASHSSTLAWKVPWIGRLPGRLLVDYRPWGHKEVDMTERFHFTLLPHS